jgi:hypothetical protein
LGGCCLPRHVVNKRWKINRGSSGNGDVFMMMAGCGCDIKKTQTVKK